MKRDAVVFLGYVRHQQNAVLSVSCICFRPLAKGRGGILFFFLFLLSEGKVLITGVMIVINCQRPV